MCNIITFRFSCQHTLRQRRSRCGGTKHKITATNIKAACTAGSSLTINLRVDCDPCRYAAWENGWKLKLARANMFLAKLQHHGMPGAVNVTALIKELEEEYATASWNTRDMFAHGPKRSVSRVKHKYYIKAASKLSQEVMPDDISEKTGKEWIDMNHLDYEGDYDASTDPIHPVSTDYSHPLDSDDEAWVLQHLAEMDGVNLSPSEENIDFYSDHGWNWSEENDDLEAQSAPILIDQRDQVSRRNIQREDATSITRNGRQNDTEVAGEKHQIYIEQVIELFWSVVASNPEQQQSITTSSPLSTDEIFSSLIDLIDIT